MIPIKKTNPTILILIGKKDWRGPAFSLEGTRKYQHCYEHLYSLAKKNNITFCRASYKWFDIKKSVFKYAWTFKNNSWVRIKNVYPNLIYDKTKLTIESQYFKYLISDKFRIVNDIEFTNILDNKYLTSLLFPSFSKKHFLIKNKFDLERASKQISGKKVVLKTISGSGGDGVYILNKNELKKIKIFSNLIAQEFVDSSAGIKGLVKGVHDLRLVFINNTLIYSYARSPKNGSLLANLSQGGSMKIIKNKHIPIRVRPLIKAVQKTFEEFNPKIYTIDLIFDKKQRPWIVELNSMPGLYFSPNQKEEMNEMYLLLIKELQKELK